MEEDESSVNETENQSEYNVPIKALRKETCDVISALLNPFKCIPTEGGIPRDWRGLAYLLDIEGQYVPNLQRCDDPVNKILSLCQEKTVLELVTCFGELDRWDIIDDSKPYIEKDIQFYKKYPNGYKAHFSKIDLDKDILTTDDIARINQGLEPLTYDAFLLFADEDIDFATELIDKMEKEYYLKLCVKDRDLVGGCFEHDAVTKLISERCKMLIVILSPSFFTSPANNFFVKFAQAIGIEQRQRKIIPCLFRETEVPAELKCYFMLDYRRSGKFFDFWEKLYQSLNTGKPSLKRTPSPIPSINQIQTNHREATLRPLNHTVKFSSMVNLNGSERENIMAEENLVPSTSTNSLGVYPVENNAKKAKSKTNWLKKILHKEHQKGETVSEKKKEKGFWNKHVKRKTAAVAN